MQSKLVDKIAANNLGVAAMCFIALLALSGCKQPQDEDYALQSSGSGSTDGTPEQDISPDPVFEPIQINGAPENQFAYPGQTINFTVAASSNTDIEYQWLHNGQIISNANSATLAVTIAGQNDSGTYQVQLSNPTTTESAAATLTIGFLPEITEDLKDVEVYPGQAAVFNVKAIGTDIEYEWQRSQNGQWETLSDSSNDTLLVSNANSNKATKYRVKVKNEGGEKTSKAANLKLKNLLAFSSQPVSQSVAPGSNVSFSASAGGYGSLSYQWYKATSPLSNSSKISGSNQPTLNISNVSNADASAYWVRVTNSDNLSIDSAKAQLSVYGPAKVTVHPADTTIYSSDTGTLFVAATGDAPLSYQWQRRVGSSWANVSGATSNQLAVSNAGFYRCVVNNGVSSDTSAAAEVTVLSSVAIVSSPNNTVANLGDSLSLNVQATGDNLQYEWSKNGQTLFSENSASLNFASLKELDEGTYGCRVFNGGGSQNCGNFNLTVNAPVLITEQPTSQSSYVGGSATFSVAASGDPAPQVQWYFKSNVVGTGNTLTLNNLSANQAGDYTCVVTNSVSEQPCTTATLTINSLAQITQQPANTSAATGSTVNLSITATGEDLNYAWYKDGQLLDNNSATLSLNISESSAGTYGCRIWNSYSSDDCNNFDIAVLTPPVILSQPQNQSAFEGASVALSVTVSGTPSPSVNWLFKGEVIETNSPTLTLNPLTSEQAGNYSCQVTNSVGTVTCNPVTVEVLEQVAITQFPASATANLGDNLSFTLVASGDNLQYEWSKNGQTLLSETSPSLSFASLKQIDEGTYGCRVFNEAGSASCPSFTLSVQSPVVISQQPVSLTANEGGSATFSVVASGNPAPTVEWYFNNGLVGTGNSLTINNVSNAHAGEYSCIVKNAVGQISCASATLSISSTAAITQQPGDTAAESGSSITLTLSATGDDLSYIWYKDGQALASGPSLVLDVTADSAGTYGCSVWNSHSSVDCANFDISVLTAPTIVSQPEAASAFEDATVELAVEVTGAPAPTVNWYHNGNLIYSGNTLTLSPLTLAQEGNYHCEVSNSVATVSCDTVAVEVLEKVTITKQPSNQVLNLGDNIVLDIQASGELPITYQCYHQTTLLITTDNPADLIIPNSSLADNGNYYCEVSNEGSSVTSQIASISVISSDKGAAELSWGTAKTRANGDNLSASEISGYTVYMSDSEDGTFEVVATTTPSTTSITLDNLAPGDYYFGLTTTDTDDIESAMSGILKITVQ